MWLKMEPLLRSQLIQQDLNTYLFGPIGLEEHQLTAIASCSENKSVL